MCPTLTLNLLTWKILWAPNNASRWQMERVKYRCLCWPPYSSYFITIDYGYVEILSQWSITTEQKRCNSKNEYICWLSSDWNILSAISSNDTVYAVRLMSRSGLHTHVSGFCCEVDDNCALQGYYAACSGNSLPTFREKLSVPSSRKRIRNKIILLGFLFYDKPVILCGV